MKLHLNHAGHSRALRIVLVCLTVLLTAGPVCRMVYILATTGAGNPSNDDEALFRQFIGPVLSGEYHWSQLPRDVFIGNHFDLLPSLVLLLFARLTRYNVFLILYAGIILAVVKLFLFHNSLTRSAPACSRLLRLALWPALAALIFSMSMITSFEFEFITIEFGLNRLGLALGVWALVRWPAKWPGVWLMALGGLIASFSFATGLAMWPVFLIGMILLGFRKAGHYIVWLGATCLAAAPYAVFGWLAARSTVLSPFNFTFLVNTIGRPFANGIGLESGRIRMGELAGAIGLMFCAAGVALLWARRRTTPGIAGSAAPSLMLIAYGLVSTWQMSVFRDTVAAWYATHSMVFWIGLLGLAYLLLQYSLSDSRELRGWTQLSGWPRDAAVWSLGLCTIVGVFYLATNRSHYDKSVYLHARGPASVACLTNYRRAPTYCECYLALWTSGWPTYMESLAKPFEDHQLAVFSADRQWSLQGASVLGDVDFHRSPGAPDIWWSTDLTLNRVAVYDYRRLNLVLHTGNWVSWSVALPARLKGAEFRSAIATPKEVTSAGPVGCSVYVECCGEPEKLVYSGSLGSEGPHDTHGWRPFSIPLIEYAGRTIKLRLTAESKSADGLAMYRYPYIDLSAEDAEAYRAGPDAVAPSNTELSPAFARPGFSDLVFDVTDPKVWRPEGLEPQKAAAAQQADASGPADAWVVTSPEPSLTYRGRVSIQGYSHLYVKMSASPAFSPRAVRVTFAVSGSPPPEPITATIPLLAGGGMHEYTYDLRLLDVVDDAQLVGLRVSPAYGPARDGSVVRIEGLRLIRRNSGAASRVAASRVAPGGRATALAGPE